MITLQNTTIRAADGQAHPAQSFDWSGPSIVAACAVDAFYGQLLLLTVDGGLHGVDLDAGSSTALSAVALPALEPKDDGLVFGAQVYKLYASPNGSHAAIVIDHGREGLVVDVVSGGVTLTLDGGDYHENTVRFSACFARHAGRDVFVHRTAWNRLDVADPATGLNLTERHIAAYESGRDPEHYLDYFHGQLRPSPSGARLFDDGWVWHPVAVPRAWSLTDWLGKNPWESEDGASLVDLTQRDDWDIPACWIDEHTIALWGLASWDVEEFAEAGAGAGVRFFDVTEREQSSARRWPMTLPDERVRDLFSDGELLYVVSAGDTTVWDIAQRALLAALAAFCADLYHPARQSLLAVGPHNIVEVSGFGK